MPSSFHCAYSIEGDFLNGLVGQLNAEGSGFGTWNRRRRTRDTLPSPLFPRCGQIRLYSPGDNSRVASAHDDLVLGRLSEFAERGLPGAEGTRHSGH